MNNCSFPVQSSHISPFNTCLLPLLSARSINYTWPWTYPCSCFPPGTVLPAPKDTTEIRNQDKPASLKLTRHCSINWQQKFATEGENKTSTRNIEKILWMETCKPPKFWAYLRIIQQLLSPGSVQPFTKAPAVLPHKSVFHQIWFLAYSVHFIYCV